MNNKVVYISDFFASDVLGGAELNDEELLKMLTIDGYEVNKIRSHNVSLDFLNANKDCFFIVSNFINLNKDCLDNLIDLEYIIYEHDHKYLKKRNPAFYKNFKAPLCEVVNFFFYKNAKKIICQSNFHKQIIEKNLKLKNIISVGGNLWSDQVLLKIKEFSKNKKENKFSILDSNIAHKNTAGCVGFCLKRKNNYELIKNPNYISFLQSLSKNEKFIFLPKSPETLSRVVVEARMLGCKVIANQMVGATQENWFSLKGEELVDFFFDKKKEILKTIKDIITQPRLNVKRPKISILSTFYKAEEFLEGFLEDITNQTIFDECEWIIIDTGSPGREQEMIKPYCEKYKNINYTRFDDRMLSTKCFNMGMMNCNSKYITWAMPDDRKSEDYLEVLYNELKNNKEIDLAYGDCIVTSVKNEKLANTKSKKLSEHSKMQFSRENMIKCLPGPMPMWTSRMINTVGFFDDVSRDFTDDWELWLRSVDAGLKFKKVDKIVGLFWNGGRSQQKNNLKQRKEEAKLFFKYKHIFGKNYQTYYPYFKQFMDLI